jgi:hypothetical protein
VAEAPLTPHERALAAALARALVRELRAQQEAETSAAKEEQLHNEKRTA